MLSCPETSLVPLISPHLTQLWGGFPMVNYRADGMSPARLTSPYLPHAALLPNAYAIPQNPLILRFRRFDLCSSGQLAKHASSVSFTLYPLIYEDPHLASPK